MSNVSEPEETDAAHLEKEVRKLQKHIKSKKKALLKLQLTENVLQNEFGGTKVQVKPLLEKIGRQLLFKSCLVVVKWGGEITHSGITQTKEYVPKFWDAMLRPQVSLVPMVVCSCTAS